MRSFREAYTQSITRSATSGTTVVLPSELAAEFWRRELIRGDVLAAVREDRIVSWDRFKETAFDLRTDRLPANRTIRALFVDELLAENAASPFITRLVPEAALANPDGFRLQITRVLPALRQSHQLATILGPSPAPGYRALLADLEAVTSRYTAFLDRHGLFEPAWLERVPAYRGGDHLLVMPELAEDFPDFAPALEGVPRVGQDQADGSSSGAQAPLPTMHLYQDSRAEFEATLGSIAALLDGGTPPESIVLTVGNLDQVRLRLVHAAELASVPLSIRQGLPLAQSAPGRFLAAIPEVVASGFSLRSLKALLLNRGIPWLDPALNAELILAGAKAGCLGGRGRPDPRWRRLSDSPERSLIDLLARELPRLTGARSATDLRARLFPFLSQVIDRDGWSPENERVLQRSLEELRSLADLESAHGLTVESPYRFWMERLGEQLYVPRTSERGIPVLPYRVGAAMYPDHHFVINLTNAAARVRVSRFPFLTEAEQDELGDSVADRDLTTNFVHAYARSGRAVTVSTSRVTWDGPALPPGEFVAAGALADAQAAISPMTAWRAEEEFGTPPARVYRLQRDGAAAYASLAAREGAAHSRVDLTEHPISDPALVDAALVAQRSTSRPDLITLSVSHIESFRGCPFGYLLERVLGLRELDFDVDPDSARDVGTLYHDVLERFFREMHESGASFDPEATGRYLERMVEILRERVASAPGMIPRFVYEALEPLAVRVFASLLETDAKLIAGERAEFVEGWERRLDVEAGAYLVGRVDRVTRRPDGSVTLVDYKKRKLPTKKAQSADSPEATGVSDLTYDERAVERDLLESLQIPFYVMLLESNGEYVDTAALYSLEEGTPRILFADGDAPEKPVMSRGRMEELVVLVDDIVRETARRLFAGDYRCAEGCPGCSYRGVCRTKFVVR